MHPTLTLDPADPAPIWRQIEDRVRRLVAAGSLAPGEAVPSVRDLARALRVNPATVVKAYQRLTEDGVLTVRRGEGTFVADRPPPLPPEERARILADAAARYCATAQSIGATLIGAVTELETAWNQFTTPDQEAAP